MIELVITILPLLALWLAAWLVYLLGYGWVSVLIGIPASGFLVRLFMIQHDCGHGAFFTSRRLNDWVGRVIGVLTMTPYDVWRQTHARHHATSGNLDRRGVGDITTLTVREYFQGSRWRRLGYRVYRHPLILLGVGPAYLFIFQQRLPIGLMRGGWRPWTSAMATNLAIAVICSMLIFSIGFKAFLLVHLPIILFAATVGVWLFFVQHQFEHTCWEPTQTWTHHHSALYGSSYYVLPGPLRWLTANIGTHHIHHLSSRIPFYRLAEVVRDHPEFGLIGRLTLRESLHCLSLVLWDESKRRLVRFSDVH